MVQTAAPGADVGDVIQNLLNRVAQLEQRITSPAYTVPNGSSPVFGSIGVGPPNNYIPIGATVSPPTSLAVSSGAEFDSVFIHATWVGSFDDTAVQYQVLIAKKDPATGIYSLVNTYLTSGLEAYIYDVDPNTIYGVKVYGLSRLNVASTPDPASGWIDVTTAVDTTIPAAPTGLSGAAGITSITVWWNENTEADVKQGKGIYELQYATNSSFTSPTTQKVGGTVTSLTGLSSSSTYYFRVRAYDSSGNVSPWSSTLSLAPGTVGSASSDGVPPASSPTPTVTGAVGAVMISFAMISNPDPVIYEIHISTTSGFTPSSGTKAATSGSSNVMLFKDASGAALVYGTTYYVKIVATDADGAAAASAQGSGTLKQASTADIAVNSITAASGIIQSLSASTITTGTMSGSFITAGTITADRLVAGTITVASGVIGSLDASTITTGTMSAARLAAGTISATTITLASTGAIVGGNNPTGVGSAQSGWIINGSGITGINAGAITFQIDATGAATFAGTLTATTFVSPTISGGTITGAVISTASSGGNRVSMDPTHQLLFYTSNTFPGQIAAFTSSPGSMFLYTPNNSSIGGSAFVQISSNVWAYYSDAHASLNISWDGAEWLMEGIGVSTPNYSTTLYLQNPIQMPYACTVSGTFTCFSSGSFSSTVSASAFSTGGTIFASGNANVGSLTTGAINSTSVTNTGTLSQGAGAVFFGSVFFDGVTSGTGSTLLINTGTGQVSYSTSSRRFKRNNEPITLDDLRPILDVPIERFEYKWDDEHTKQIGPMAEDVAAALPELVIYDDLKRPQDVRSQQGAWLWIPFIKDLYERIEALEAA